MNDGSGDGTVFTQNVLARTVTINTVHGGDQYNYIYRDTPPYRVEPYPLNPGGTWPGGLERLPSRLLTARHRIVPFSPRPELGALERWRDAGVPGLSVRLLYAEGGQGKTRLAAEFAARSARGGWTVAQARHRSEVASAGGGDETLAVRPPGLIMVVDYAERWPTADLITLIRQHRDAARDRLRILLLSRPAGDWWQALAHQLGKLDIVDSEAVRLAALPDDPQTRAEAYTSARDAFGAVFGLADSAAVAVPDGLEAPRYGLTLTTHMKALVDVDAAARGVEPPSGRDLAGLSSYLLDREHDHWRSVHDEGRGPVPTRERVMRRAVYVATLTPPLAGTEASAALVRTGAAEPAEADQVVRDHAHCYPPQTADRLLESLAPDRLAEDFLALTLPGFEERHRYHATDDWAAVAPAMLLRYAEGTDPPAATRHSLTVLIEAARRWPHVIDRHLVPLLATWPGLAPAAGGAALSRLCELSELPDSLLELIVPQLPRHRHVDLDLGVAAVTRRVVRYRLAKGPVSPAEEADLLFALASRYANAGLLGAAEAPAREAVELRRRLAAVDRSAPPAPSAPSAQATSTALAALAAALNSLADLLITTGRFEEATAPMLEAVELHRRLAEQDAVGHSVALAYVLNNLGVQLLRTGRAAEAVAASTEAAGLLREPPGGDPEAHLPALARALTNLSNAMAETGQLPHGVGLAREALRIHRRLTGADRAQHLPDLAMSLLNSGQWLMMSGDPAQALALTEEAVGLYDELARINPTAYLAHLGSAWDNRGNILAVLRRPEEALEATRKGLEIRERLAAGDPLRAPAVAKSLTNLSIRLSQTPARTHPPTNPPTPEDGLAPVREAILLWRPLAAANPAHLPDFATALYALDHWLTRAGRPEEAVGALEERIVVLGEAARESGAQLPELAAALHDAGGRRARAGEPERAVEHLAEAVSLRRRLVEGGTAADAAALLDSADLLGACLVDIGRALEAAMMTVRTVDAMRRNVAREPESFGPLLLDGVMLVGLRLAAAGRTYQAIAALRGALELVRTQSATDPSASMERYAFGLRHLAVIQAAAGVDVEDAVRAADAAVRICRQLAADLPAGTPFPALTDALDARATVLRTLGRA
ncbi:tetratricopeptide repeat protein [Kitasatospora sp. NPDC004723]|uniref:tetratricopeptide repeat protein n=1 Tax=Kitasatospora sp. NPDC004723 TaxID=3154288 RepID=UPI0033B32325